MANVVAILEDNADRIAAMRACLSQILPAVEVIFFEEAQTMETFRSRALDGFVLLKEVVFASVFLLSLIVALRWIRPAVFAVMTAVTGALVVVAAVWDYTTPCSDEGCPELRGLVTAAAVGLAVLVWATTLLIAAVVSRLRDR